MQTKIEKKSNKTIYNIKFGNLTALYDYLISDPIINKDVFPRPASIYNDEKFAGARLDKSIGYCIKGYKEAEKLEESDTTGNNRYSTEILEEEKSSGYEKFLKTNIHLRETALSLSDNRVLTRTLYGGVPQPALVAAGVHDCMLRYERDSKSAVRNIYFNLAYPSYTTTEQIINRGLATLFIVQALEAKGEMINFRAFELSKVCDEIVNIEVSLKKPGDVFLNIEKCYYPIKAKEFLRRVLFRVLESSSVKEKDWGVGYGIPMTEQEIREFFRVKPHDLVISSPDEMGIEGDDIYDDTISLINNLGIQKEFDIPKIKSLKQNNKRR